MELITAIFLGVLGFGVFWLLRSRGKPSLPPGPLRLPLVGCYFTMKFPLRVEVKDHMRRYGDVSCFQFGAMKLTICLNSHKVIKEAFIQQGEAFSGRPRHFFSELLFKNSGLVMNDGETWKKHRRFSLKTLRDFGLGRNLCEEIIAKEAEELCTFLSQNKDTPIDVQKIFATTVSNVICLLIFSQRLASEDPKFDEKLTLITQITQVASKPTFLGSVILPLMAKLFPSAVQNSAGFKRAQHLVQSLLDYCQSIIDEKKKHFMPENEPRDYVEAYLAERNRLGDAEAKEFGDYRLTVSIFDLFLAGTETTANSLRWIVLTLARLPDLQERVHEAVAKVLGHRPARMADKKELGIIEALIEECQRFHVLVPTGVSHRVLSDTVLCGYHIPKDASVVANFQQVHFNPEIFPEPQKFDIDRFLESNGSFKASEYVIPFSIGKRSCLGESLARMELFLFTCALVQRFKVSFSPEDASKLDEVMLGSDGTVNAPRCFNAIFSEREDFVQ